MSSQTSSSESLSDSDDTPESSSDSEDLSSNNGLTSEDSYEQEELSNINPIVEEEDISRFSRDPEDFIFTQTGFKDISKVRPLDSYDNPYVSRDHPDIQSLWCCKKEIRECESGPNPAEDDRVSPIYFNYQVAYARYLAAYGSNICTAEPGSGKTGAIKCFQTYAQSQESPTITT